MNNSTNYFDVSPDWNDEYGVLDSPVDDQGQEFPDMSKRASPQKATTVWSDKRHKHGDCVPCLGTGHLILSERCFLKLKGLVLQPNSSAVPTVIMKDGRPQFQCITYYFPDKMYDIVNINKTKAEWYSDGSPMRFIGTPVVDVQEILGIDIVLTRSLGYVVSQAFKDIVEENKFQGFCFVPLQHLPRKKGDPIGHRRLRGVCPQAGRRGVPEGTNGV